MIYCASCGTANRDGSRFCNECGLHLVAAEQIQCAMCGTSNPKTNTHCVGCGTGLTPGAESEQPAEGMAKVTSVEGRERGQEGEGDLPVWLERMRTAALMQDAGQQADDETDARLAALGPVDMTLETEDDVGEGEEVPDWLARLQAMSPVEPEEDVPGASDVDPMSLVEEGVQEKEEAEDAAEDLPEWLTLLDQQGQEEEGELPASQVPAILFDDEEGLPPWLLGAQDAEAPQAVEAESVAGAQRPFPEEAPGAEDVAAGVEHAYALPAEDEAADDIHDWVSETDAVTGDEEPEAEEEEFGGDVEAIIQPMAEERVTGELPSDHALEIEDVGSVQVEGVIADSEEVAEHEQEIARQIEQERAPEEDEAVEAEEEGDGVLAGLRGILPIALPVATSPETTDVGSLLLTTPDEVSDRELSPSARMPGLPDRRKTSQTSTSATIGRLLLSVLLLMAIALPMLTGIQLFRINPRTSAELQELHGMIEGLSAGDAVLLAFDYEPSTADEMNPMAEALLGHLLQRRARVITVSLLPTGPAMAHRSVEQAVASLDGQDHYYLNLGYLPGNESGLRAFLADPFGEGRVDYVTGLAVTEQMQQAGLTSLDGLSMIVVLSASPQHVRWWVEQVGSQVDVPIVAGVSAAAEPFSRPYRQAIPPQLAGMVSGLAGAAQYQRLSGEVTTLGLDMEALSWASVLVLLVILAAVFVSPFRGRRRGR